MKKQQHLLYRIGLLLMLASFISVPILADKLILKGGKVIHGKITDEDEYEVTIRVKGGMNLRFEHSEIKEVIRPKPKGPARNTITLESINRKQEEEEKKKEIQKKEQEKAKKRGQQKKEEPKEIVEPKKKDELDNIKQGQKIKATKKGVLTLYKKSISNVYKVKGRTFKQTYKGIYSKSDGKGFMDGIRRVPSNCELAFSWGGTPKKEGGKIRWESVVLNTTITVTSPYWDSSRNPKEAERNKWNDFIADVRKHNQHRIDIYLRGIKDLGESLSALRKPDEKSLRQSSEELYTQTLDLIDKRERGYVRRHRVDPKAKKSRRKK